MTPETDMTPYHLITALLTIVLSSTSIAKPDSESSQMVDNLANFRFDQLGHPQIQSDSIAPVLATSDRPHKLLIIPVRFSDKGYDRFVNEATQDQQNRDYFQQLLFSGGAQAPKEGTLSHYYRHQSRGLYNVTGDIFPVVELDQPLHYYGRPIQNSDGSWRNDENATQLVVDSLQAAYRGEPDFPWQDYDQWDPNDFDGDGNKDEPDGYLDHFILIVAGKGQASCQGLYKLGEKLNANATPDAFDDLTMDEKNCADRIWPHRFSLSQNLGRGPQRDGVSNARGGVDIGNGLWVLDYNMQSEYTEVSTFIHEFGHSLGLPDVYARQTNNSTASWEAMSATSSPAPQELSTWSRMVLGWMQPCIVRPEEFGGAKTGTINLKTMNDWAGLTGPGRASPGLARPGLARQALSSDQCDSAMVILPPKFRDIEMGPLTPTNGTQAVYSGQGNGMNRTLSKRFDLRKAPAGQQLLMSLDTWFEIEAEWDYFYVEAALDGQDFQRLMPTDKDNIQDKKSVMPSDKGHEGKGSVPGFTGLSGDLDGDGKVELAKNCDPNAARVLAEDRIGSVEIDPCEASQWVQAQFDLEQFRGQQVTIRFTYFTDMAAVENGALIDNIKIPAIGFQEDFEGSNLDGWSSQGFTLSSGSHHLAVPHFYLLEYRDPYETFTEVKNYDNSLAQPGFQFFPDSSGGMSAFNVNYRAGVLMWYYNGEYLWSQNEPAESGPGRGFLLLVDANPQEFELPAVPAKYFKRDGGWSFWDFDDEAQPMLKKAFVDTMCFGRRASYYSTDVAAADRKHCEQMLENNRPPMEQLSWEGRPLLYGYTIVNELLPGADRRAHKSGGSLFDLRIRDGVTQYRLYDRALRNHHSADAPFALEPFANGVEIYTPVKGEMQRQSATPFAPVSQFTDARPNRYQNPKLPFGGADIPEVGFRYQLQPPDKDAPAGTKVKVDFSWH